MSVHHVSKHGLISALLCLVCCFGLAPKAVAQSKTSQTVQGIVTDAATHEPVAGAQVWIKDSSYGTIADAEGRYSIKYEGKFATLRLPSGEMRMVPINCRATIGVVGNGDHNLINVGKAGRKRHMGIRPTVRGSVMNPNDHPHGGGEGRAPIGRPGPSTPWGKPALGYKTRKHKKQSDKLIVRRRNGKGAGSR